jgi:hypothetical protein
MRLAAGLQAPRRLEVRCRAPQRRMLRAIGAQTVERLSVVTERL